MPNGIGRYGYLDRIRITEGSDKCRQAFRQTAAANPEKALALLNSERLTFPCLYLLLPEAEAFRPYLSSRRQTALKIAGRFSRPQSTDRMADELSVITDDVRSALKWMLETGWEEEGLGDEYDAVLDRTAAVLTVTYHDNSVLPTVADMIFRRNRRDAYLHDLVWALFRAGHPDALKAVAAKLDSPDGKDAALARGLLGLEPPRPGDSRAGTEGYLRWLKENDPFLYFTGESLQFSSQPAFCKVDRERKYLCRTSGSYIRQALVPANEEEKRYLEAFSPLGQEEKQLLSDFSYQIYRQNPEKWREWLRRPLDVQISSARNNREGLRWL